MTASGVTYLVGENGVGKSTLLEAIAVAAGFNAEGGSINFSFSTRPSHSVLHERLRLRRWHVRPKDGFFLRAESCYNVATYIEDVDSVPMGAPRIIDSYGGRSLYEQSHSESFLALLNSRFGGRGLYILDEVVSSVELFLANGRVHADLSPFNILYWNGGFRIIDFPQAVGPYTNPDSYGLLLRDVENVCTHFARYGVEEDAHEIFSRIWRANETVNTFNRFK